ncbi:transcription initiation factor TFIIA, small subunit [Metarhizium robertsii ARSEF 23]|uniref:Transcription initiation factor TFIIA, small subunit n=1 Tax=Metarhizium robertsii (strain ARSEF 23 / ATCC MYA-3075) TaxID=655844 RepID=A0A0B2XFQ9_METRA|nr:transcription initiation factor TFIIA, small subunit [Metarhizium robertsii ARSEF 23]KHO10859.1 transcription initiation factor TFIIA, small subunit [Metarhizium robertsii ARSEF 23]
MDFGAMQSEPADSSNIEMSRCPAPAQCSQSANVAKQALDIWDIDLRGLASCQRSQLQKGQVGYHVDINEAINIGRRLDTRTRARVQGPGS